VWTSYIARAADRDSKFLYILSLCPINLIDITVDLLLFLLTSYPVADLHLPGARLVRTLVLLGLVGLAA